MNKILNMPVQYFMLALAVLIAVLSFVIPVILKLAKKKDGKFRSGVLVAGLALAVVILMLATFIETFNASISIRTFLTIVGKIILILVVILVCICLFDQFIDWISKD